MGTQIIYILIEHYYWPKYQSLTSATSLSSKVQSERAVLWTGLSAFPSSITDVSWASLPFSLLVSVCHKSVISYITLASHVSNYKSLERNSLLPTTPVPPSHRFPLCALPGGSDRFQAPSTGTAFGLMFLPTVLPSPARKTSVCWGKLLTELCSLTLRMSSAYGVSGWDTSVTVFI